MPSGYYDALTVGIDFTAREMQQRLRENGLPWDISKGFDGAAVIGEWIDKQLLRDIHALPFHLELNNKTVQEGLTADMNFGIDQLISYISRFYTLKTGDLLFTGTPAGVGPVKPDDHLIGYIEERKVLDFYCR